MNKLFVLKSFIFITLFLFIISFVRTFNFNTPILNMPSVYNVIDVNISFKQKNIPSVLFKINNSYTKSKTYKNIIRNTFSGKINTFDILIKKSDEKDIKDIVIFNDIKLHYFKDFSKFEKEEIGLNGQYYLKCKVPNSVKWNKNSNSYNDRGMLNIFSVSFLSLLSNFKLGFLPFAALFITLIYYINLKGGLPEFKYPYALFVCIFLIGILLRLNTLYDNVIPWGDECYSVIISNPNLPFETIFKDVGNPPFFYFLLRIWFSIFNISLISAKTFPFILGIFALFNIWFSIKKLASVSAANFGLFMASINLPLIYYSGEIRGYILEISIVPLLIYFLMQIFKTDKKRYYFLYFLFALMISNTHFYATLFLMSNFIYSFFYFIKNKRRKSLVKFLVVNLMAILPFMCYLFFYSYKNSLLNLNFNVWVPDISAKLIKECILFSFNGIISLILSITFFIKNIYRKTSSLLNYLFINIVLIFLISIVFSVFVRNILFYTYFIIIFPIFIMFVSGVFEKEYKNRFMPAVFIIWVLFIQTTIYPIQNRRRGFFEYPISFANQYLNENNPNESIYVMAPFSPFGLGYEKNYSDKIKYAFKIELKTPSLSYDDSYFKLNKGFLFTSLYDIKNKDYQKECFYNETSKAEVCYLKRLID